MKQLVLILLLFSHAAYSETKEQWFCTDETSQRQGDVWYACGIGEGMTEGEARSLSLTASIREFGRVCEISSDCNGVKRTVEPKRTSCLESKDKIWKCYRLIQITLLR